jgi:hypothetical protein
VLVAVMPEIASKEKTKTEIIASKKTFFIFYT